MKNQSQTCIELSTIINADIKTVWHKMLDLVNYKIWTTEFAPGSFYEGNWDLNSKISFSSDMGGGISGTITQNKYLEILTITFDGGWIDKEGKAHEAHEVKDQKNQIEQYTFTSISDNKTQLDIYADTTPQYHEMMFDMWPKALQKLKTICEV